MSSDAEQLNPAAQAAADVVGAPVEPATGNGASNGGNGAASGETVDDAFDFVFDIPEPAPGSAAPAAAPTVAPAPGPATSPPATKRGQPPARGRGPGPQKQPQPRRGRPAAGPRQPVREAQLSRGERRRRVRLQARKVRRIVRHIEPWSVLKVSVIFYACMWVIFLIGGVLLWSAAENSAWIDNIESFIRSSTERETFEIQGGQIFRAYSLFGVVMVIAGTAFNVLVVVLFNLISDVVGGIRMTVIEEESARFRPPKPTRRRVETTGRPPTAGGPPRSGPPRSGPPPQRKPPPQSRQPYPPAGSAPPPTTTSKSS